MSRTVKNKDLRHRSFKGCWTCKKRRIQCDEVRPTCQKCSSRGITCEGYEIRLRWGAGIASRGKYSGAKEPVKDSMPPRSKRRWDMRGKGHHLTPSDGQGEPILVSEQLNKGEAVPEQQIPQLAVERATVNILNWPCEPDSLDQAAAINKHFEIPASLATLAQASAHIYADPTLDTLGQYSQNSGRRSIPA
ncbi:hypothetical protein N7457_002329 [Penicillium paradoxum]|uniref:uncharacterized protein n=1 Tax=Penicillium paradoxum TaxID=176176 RepID=UPI002546E5AB|nr:uncharacterized protein N7457_002329 [Penicillium paradoxum]KAJ5787339.1 hypothetical protein N7457_002329 [Penicillium paradoxum]